MGSHELPWHLCRLAVYVSMVLVSFILFLFYRLMIFLRSWVSVCTLNFCLCSSMHIFGDFSFLLDGRVNFCLLLLFGRRLKLIFSRGCPVPCYLSLVSRPSASIFNGVIFSSKGCQNYSRCSFSVPAVSVFNGLWFLQFFELSTISGLDSSERGPNWGLICLSVPHLRL